MPKLYNDLFATKHVDPITKKVKWTFKDPLKVYTSGGHIERFAYDQILTPHKRLNLQKIYHALFDHKNPYSGKIYDRLNVSFDVKAETMTFAPGHVVSVPIPKMTFWNAICAEPEPGSEEITLEEKIMGIHLTPPYGTPHKPVKADNEGDTTARPSAIDRFNARLAKTRAMQGLDGK